MPLPLFGSMFRGISLSRAKAHFRTITTHKLLVMRYCFQCGLYRQGLLHDLSKYSASEFWIGARYYQGNRSPNDAERQSTGASTAWMHHKGRNKHHFEYWTDYQKTEDGIIVAGTPMPVRYIAEMLCDRIAACRVYQGDKYNSRMPLEYFLRGNKHKGLMHPETADLLEKLLRMTASYGERRTFAYIRRQLSGSAPFDKLKNSD